MAPRSPRSSPTPSVGKQKRFSSPPTISQFPAPPTASPAPFLTLTRNRNRRTSLGAPPATPSRTHLGDEHSESTIPCLLCALNIEHHSPRPGSSGDDSSDYERASSRSRSRTRSRRIQTAKGTSIGLGLSRSDSWLRGRSRQGQMAESVIYEDEPPADHLQKSGTSEDALRDLTARVPASALFGSSDRRSRRSVDAGGSTPRRRRTKSGRWVLDSDGHITDTDLEEDVGAIPRNDWDDATDDGRDGLDEAGRNAYELRKRQATLAKLAGTDRPPSETFSPRMKELKLAGGSRVASQPPSVTGKRDSRQLVRDAVDTVGRGFMNALRRTSNPVRESLSGLPSPLVAHPFPFSRSDSSAQTAGNATPTRERNAFSERFRYVVCTSFLLAPTLSISLYETSGIAAEAAAATAVGGARAVAEGEGADERPPTVSREAVMEGTSTPRSPSLRRQWGLAEKALLLAVSFIVLPVTWLFLLVILGFTAVRKGWWDPSLPLFTSIAQLGRQSSPVSYLLVTPVKPTSTQLQVRALKRVERLVQAAQDFDVTANKALGAVQETELVARGYRITHPMSPISRIEDSDPLLRAGSPPPILRSTSPPPISRPMSPPLTRRVSGRFSPAPTSPSVYGRHSPVDGGPHGNVPRRLALLRRLLSQSLQGAEAACRTATVELAPLVEEDELDLLIEMYGVETDGAFLDDSPHDALPPSVLGDVCRPVPSTWSSTSFSSSYGRPDGDQTWTAGGLDRRMSGAGAQVRSPNSVTSPRTGLRRLSLESSSGWSSSGNEDRRRSGPMGGLGSPVLSPSDGVRSPRLSYVRSEPDEDVVMLDDEMHGRRSSGVSSSAGSISGGSGDKRRSQRLSYISTGSGRSRPSSIVYNSPSSRASPVVATPNTPSRAAAPSLPSLTSPTRRDSAARYMPPRHPVATTTAATAAAAATAPADPYSLSSLKSSFHTLHTYRRRTLCHLLALNFGGEGAVGEEEEMRGAYWAMVGKVVQQLLEALVEVKKDVARAVEREMAVDLGAGLAAEEKLKESRYHGAVDAHLLPVTPVSPKGGGGGGGTFSRPSVIGVFPPTPTSATRPGEGHPTTTYDPDSLLLPGARKDFAPSNAASAASAVEDSLRGGPYSLEGRLGAMSAALRSVQVKLRVCADDLRLQHPSPLHGEEVAPLGVVPARAADEESAEAIFESVREDLLALTREWEGGRAALRKARADAYERNKKKETQEAEERLARMTPLTEDLMAPSSAGGSSGRRGGRPESGGSTTDSSDSQPPSSTSSYLPHPVSSSSFETERTATNRSATSSDATAKKAGGGGAESDADSLDHDLSALLLESTSPNFLPPPGLEQVFEAVAGLARGTDVEGKEKMTREERIQSIKASRLREAEKKRRNGGEAGPALLGEGERATDTIDSTTTTSMVAELKDVIGALRQRRGQPGATASPAEPSLSSSPSLASNTATPHSAATPLPNLTSGRPNRPSKSSARSSPVPPASSSSSPSPSPSPTLLAPMRSSMAADGNDSVLLSLREEMAAARLVAGRTVGTPEVVQEVTEDEDDGDGDGEAGFATGDEGD